MLCRRPSVLVLASESSNSIAFFFRIFSSLACALRKVVGYPGSNSNGGCWGSQLRLDWFSSCWAIFVRKKVPPGEGVFRDHSPYPLLSGSFTMRRFTCKYEYD